MIRLLVKGSRFAALEAARKRGVDVVEYKHITSTPTLSVFYVPDTYLARVAKWFGEPGDLPYPPGTLLHYVIPREPGF